MSAPENTNVESFYVGGEWISPRGTETVPVTDSSTGEVIATVPAADREDVSIAVDAAAKAGSEWSAVPLEERTAMVAALGDRLAARVDDLARMEAIEIGTPLAESRDGQVMQAAEFLSEIPSEAAKIEWVTQARNARALRVPAGVVGAITAWNFPLQIISAKAGAALAAGCTVVVKASEVAPLSSFAFAEEAAQIGFPPGALNVLTGYGAKAGQALVEHQGVDKVGFTGSVDTAKRIAATAASRLLPLALELGGKSASVILEDADLDQAVRGSIANCFQGSGQVCCATTRTLVPRELLAAAEEIAAAAIAEEWPVGAALAEGTRIGPMVSAQQRDRVVGYIAAGEGEGARLIAGGSGALTGGDHGFFVPPTVFSGDNTMRIAREEIFGPVLSLVPYENGDDGAIEIANDSPYGLGGAVWSSEPDHAVSVAGRLRTGQVEINGAPWDPIAPFGGFGQSGYGRENGRWGIEEFTTWKAIHL